MQIRHSSKRKILIEQPEKQNCFGQPSKEDYQNANYELNYDPNIMPEHNIRASAEDHLYHLTETLEDRWLKSLLFGCDCNSIKCDSKLEAQLSAGQAFFKPVLFSKLPRPNISENYLKIRYVKHQLRHSDFAWNIDLLGTKPCQALESWLFAFQDWEKNNRLTPSGTYCKEQKIYNSEKQFSAFHHSTLYLLSCFGNNPKGENINPAAISNFLSFEYYKTRETWRAFLSNYTYLQQFQSNYQPEINNETKRYSGNLSNGYIFFRNTANNTLVHNIYILFEKHLERNCIPKTKLLDKMLISLIERTIRISQVDVVYNFFLPYILTHIFSEFLTDSYESDYIKNCLNRTVLFPNRETTFPTLKRLTANHQRVHTKYISDEQYYVQKPNPLINFMEDVITSLFDLPYYLNIQLLNDTTREKYISHMQANWLAFYLENNRAYFKNQIVCGEKSGCFFPRYFEELFFTNNKQSSLELDFRWIQRFAKYNKKSCPAKVEQIVLNILFKEVGTDYTNLADEIKTLKSTESDYFYDPELWKSGHLAPQYEEDESAILYINRLIVEIQKATRLSISDAAELTRRGLLSIFFVPALDVLESYLNNMHDPGKQLSLFLDLHIFKQKETILNLDEKYMDFIQLSSKFLTESAMNESIRTKKVKFVSDSDQTSLEKRVKSRKK